MATGGIGEAKGEARRFLLLQGPFSFFFSDLAAALRARGAETRRAILCPGDALFHRGPGAIRYRGAPEAWGFWLRALLAQERITDLVMLGDGRFWHDEAARLGRSHGLRVHVVEQGYLRPGFLTVEPDGTGGRTRFPRDWAAIDRLAEGAPPVPAPRFRTSFAAYAAMDVGFNLANLALSWTLYPHYRRHSLDHPVAEWAGWVWNKGLRRGARRAALRAAEARLAAAAGPLYLHPLQLDTDFQMRLHAPPGGVGGMLARVIRSFAAHAPANAALAVKVHPLDHGWARWDRRAAALAAEAGVAERVVFLDGGDLDAMLGRAAGVVVANSTVGLSALRAGAPTLALGTAIYDLEGLTFQGELDAFWRSAAPPDPARLDLFTRALAAAIHVLGGFDGEGARPGAAAMAEKMLAPPPWPREEEA